MKALRLVQSPMTNNQEEWRWYVWASFIFMHVMSRLCATEMLSKLYCTAGITEELFEDCTTQISSSFAQLNTSLTHNCSIMIYWHTLADLFIIRKPAWTPVVCDNTGTCPNSRVCINVMYCQLCYLKQLATQFWNRFWNGKVVSTAYLAAQMKWDIHWFTMKCTSTRSEAQSGVTTNRFFLHIRCINCSVNNKIKFLPLALPLQLFPVASSTNYGS